MPNNRPEYYKVLGPDLEPCHGGSGRYRLRRWMPPVQPEPCKRGYHVCRPLHLIHRLGPKIHPAKVRGQIIEGDNKIVASEVLIHAALPTWTERTARLFAADCAEAVVRLCGDDPRPQQAIYAARLFAAGMIGTAARQATREATWEATRTAAWEAARVAGWAAAGAAAGAAAWEAARAAARAAAGAAAGAAAQATQTQRLLHILHDPSIEPEWAEKLAEAEARFNYARYGRD